MRVLFLTSTLPRFVGDMQADFVGEQARAWLAARPQDEIVILAPGDAAARQVEDHGRLQVRRFPYMPIARWQSLAYPAILPNIRRRPLAAIQLPFFLVAQYRAAKRLVRERNIDLVYAHWVMPQGLVAHRLRSSCDVPYVLQNHSSDLAVFAKAGAVGRGAAKRLLGDALRFFCVNADQLAFATSFFDGAERDAFAAKAQALPMGLAGGEPSRATGHGYDIATIGRLSRKKGLDFLIAAAERLAARGVRPRIGIAGDGEERAALERLVVDADIHFTGFLTGEEKAAFLSETQRFAFPAKAADGDVEGMPVAMLEALARGMPVLASRDTNIELLPEWNEIRDAVVFVEDPADLSSLELALQRLLVFSPASAERASEAIRRYRWDSLIGEYIAIIELAIHA